MTGKLRNMTSVYITRGNQILLLYRVGSRVVAPSWCGIGGHFETDELNDARLCAMRELYEEVGVAEGDLCAMRMRYVTLRLKNGEIRQNYYFFAEASEGGCFGTSGGALPLCSEGELAWVDFTEAMLERDMPYTAKEVLRHYLKEGCRTELVYGGIAEQDGVRFIPLAEF